MAIYSQNSIQKVKKTQEIMQLFLDDIAAFGDNHESLYRQDEAIIIKMLLATHYMDNPNLRVGTYIEPYSTKQIPNIRSITRAIQRVMTDTLPSFYLEKRKEALLEIQKIRPKKEDIDYIFENYHERLDRTNMIVQYYMEFYNITKKTRVIDWLDVCARIDVPSLQFIDIAFMHKEEKKKKDK